MNHKYLFVFILSIFYSLVSKGQTLVTVSGSIIDKNGQYPLSFVNVILKSSLDSSFVVGTVSDEVGYFLLQKVKPGNYILETSFIGYKTQVQVLYVGSLSEYLSLNKISLEEDKNTLSEILVTGKAEEVSERMDKKTFSLSDNVSQQGGSILQAMQNLPSVTVQDGKILLRGNDKITILIDGKQTALTGFGSQNGLDNIPASAIEKIEIINNPSAKYDANGNAGIVNIIYKKHSDAGWNGKLGFTTGLGALWQRRENLPDIRPQYKRSPKLNPNGSLHYKTSKINAYIDGDYLYTETLNKNEFVLRTYDDGEVVNQQLKRNRNTHFLTTKTGIDFTFNDANILSVSSMFGSEKIIDRGDEPFFNVDLTQRYRLWQFLEDELKTTVMASTFYQHKYKQAGHHLDIGFNYTFHREDEKYYYDNILPNSVGTDAFKLISDEQVFDLNVDYTRPLKYGSISSGIKLRQRNIPTNMQFIPGINSVLDVNAGGWATYKELIPSMYAIYVLDTKKWEAELGLRIEYVDINYEVNPDHVVYKSDQYSYTQPFPNFRFAYKILEDNKLSLFFNRRVDRPNEVDIRIFPKYDDAEIIKVGNPALKPQFTNTIEIGHKKNWARSSLFSAVYYKFATGTITRIASIVEGSNLIYAVFQNADKSYHTGVEVVYSQKLSSLLSFNTNINLFKNQIDAFSVINKYPIPSTFTSAKQEIYSGSFKINSTLKASPTFLAQLSIVYLAPDIIPQGKIKARYSLDAGFKKTVHDGKGEIFLNASDLLNTMVPRKEINGRGFHYTSQDYYETQVVRIGYKQSF